MSSFQKKETIGRGGFGKVHVVEKDGIRYAMKEMLKTRILNKDSIESVVNELAFLRKIDKENPSSNFIVNVNYAF